MSKTIKNKFDENLTYEKLMEAHKKSRKGKGYRNEVIEFNLKQEEYILWLYNSLKNQTYKHGGYKVFYITEPKLRKIEKSRYIDRIVHRWIVDNFLEPYYVPTFINTSYACLKNRGMHKAAIDVQSMMRKAKNKWQEYYVLKMDIAKYFDSINKNILFGILKRKIKDKKLIWLINEILFSQKREKGLEIRKLYISNKHTSICYFDILMSNNTIIKIKAYDDLADLCYMNLEENYFINICGKLYQNYEVELIEFEVYL